MTSQFLQFMLTSVLGRVENIQSSKKCCTIEELPEILSVLIPLLQEIKEAKEAESSHVVKLIHNTLSPFLHTEGVIHPSNQLLPFAELLALFFRLFTPYVVQVSTIEDEDSKEVFSQIDEEKNKFYFAFFKDHFEFAFNNFNEYKNVPLSVILANPGSLPLDTMIMKNLGASDCAIRAWIGATMVFPILPQIS